MLQLISAEVKSKILIFALQMLAVTFILVLIATIIGDLKRKLRKKLADKKDKNFFDRIMYDLLSSNQSTKQKGNPIIYIDNMTGIQFEVFLKEMFKILGYTVHKTPDSGDYGADLYMEKGGKKYVVQAKRSKGKIGLSAVQEVVTSKAHYNAEIAVVITNNYLTANAKTLAKNNNVIVYERPELIKLVRKSKMIMQNKKQVSKIS